VALAEYQLNRDEAATSTVSVLVTVVLVFINGPIRGTHETIGRAANAELLRQIEASTARRRELASQISFLGSALDSLPDRDNWNQADRLMRTSTDWDNFDFAKLRACASEISEAAASWAATLESKMRWIAELVNSVKLTPSGRGYDWTNFPRERWEQALLATRQALDSISKQLSP